jgi:GNAT superfamily N-acetyltransferase
MSAGYRISTATVGDSSAIADHVNSAYRGDSSRAGWTTEADLLDGTRTDAAQIQDLISKNDSVIEIVRDERGALVACVHLVREPPPEVEVSTVIGNRGKPSEDGTCYLGMLTVKPKLQASGLGRLLLNHSEEVARTWGCRRIRMTVIDRRPELIAYYERRGYARNGREYAFHGGDPRFGIPRVELRMIELVKVV